MVSAVDVVNFWREAGAARWFAKDLAFDQEIVARFGDVPDQIVAGGYAEWQNSAEGMLALILALDQFPRNMFRGTAKSFAFDEVALGLARSVIEKGWDAQIEGPLKPFFYLPFMHSENLDDQYFCLELYQKMNDQSGADFAQRHLDIIERFGRFPHRNEILGRRSTEEELQYLQEEDAGF